MTNDLPEDLLAELRARVLGGQFTSIDDAVAESVRLMFGLPVHDENRLIAGIAGRPGWVSIGLMSDTSEPARNPDPVLGSMRDAAEELDAMEHRARNALNAKLLEGLEGEMIEMTRADWDAIRREAREVLDDAETPHS